MAEAVLLNSFVDLPIRVLLAVGFFVALRVLKFPDLTIEATFVAGGVGAAWGATQYDSSLAGLLVAVMLGAVGGSLTALLYAVHRTPVFKLLASVIVMFSFYSINFRLLGNKSDVNFASEPTALNRLTDWEALNGYNKVRPFSTLLGYLIVAVVLCCLYLLFRTDIGVLLRSIGARASLVASCGRNPTVLLWLGLALSNAIVALAGWLAASSSGNININTFGTIIHALAALVLGEMLVDVVPRLKHKTVSVATTLAIPLIGASLYQLLTAAVTYILTIQTRDGSVMTVWTPRPQDQNLFFSFLLTVVIIAARLLQWNRRTVGIAEADAL